MNLHYLAVFHAVAETGSVSLGAERLMVSQPAVSKQIGLLEKQLKVRLFDRHPRGVRLTPAGQTLAGYARRVFGLIADARVALDDLDSLRSGTLTIGAGPTVGNYLLPRVMVRFRQRFPGIRMRLETGGADVLRERLLDGVLDLVLTESKMNDEVFVGRPFGSDVLVPIVSPHNVLVSRKQVRPTEFCAQPFIARDTSTAGQSFVERTLQSRGFLIQPYMTLGSTEAIKQAVIADLGVTMLSRLAVASEIAGGQLLELRIKGFAIEYSLHHYQLRGRTESRPTRAFLDLLEQDANTTRRPKQR